MTSQTSTSIVGLDYRIFRNSSLATQSPIVLYLGQLTSFTNSVTKDTTVKSGWKGKIARGLDATTPMSGTRLESKWGPGDVVVLNTYSFPGQPVSRQYYRFMGSFWGVAIPPAGVSASSSLRAKRMALTAFNNKVTAAASDFQSLVSAGELGETLRTIRNPAKAIRGRLNEYLFAVKKRFRGRRKLSVKNANRIIADTWLEAMFGMRPLISDVDSAVHALANVLTYLPDRKFCKGEGQDTEVSAFTVGSNHTFGPLTLKQGGYADKATAKYRFYGSVGILDDYGDVSYLRRFGCTWDNVIPAIWELIPYSFIVDYFTNIGDIISAASRGRAGLKWVSQGLCEENERMRTGVSYTIASTGDIYTKYSLVSFSPGRPGSARVRFIQRGGYSDSLIPSFGFEIPGMSTKWLNLAALGLSSRSITRQLQRDVLHAR